MKKNLVLHQKVLEIPSLPENDEETVSKILKNCENHPSVSKTKCNQNETLNFDFPTTKVEDISKIIKRLKILKIAKNAIDSHLTNIIN